MPEIVRASILRFPPVDGILNTSFNLTDGATVTIREITRDLSVAQWEDADIWELPVVRYIAARELGLEVTALPIFGTRRFVQWMVEVPEDSDIATPKDLEGRRIVQHTYSNGDCVWTKGILEDDYGVDLSNVSWVTVHQEILPGTSAPEGVVCIDGADRDSVLLDGVVDAALTSGHGAPPPPNVRRLWTNPEVAAAEWFATAQFFPMLHVLVVRNSALEAHDSLARELFAAFDTAKRQALEQWEYGATLPESLRASALWSGFPGSNQYGSDRGFLGLDPMPYGLDNESNRVGLERLIRYGLKQQVTQHSHTLEELFAPVE